MQSWCSRFRIGAQGAFRALQTLTKRLTTTMAGSAMTAARWWCRRSSATTTTAITATKSSGVSPIRKSHQKLPKDLAIRPMRFTRPPGC